MDIESIREYCLGLAPGVEETFPFGPDDLVFKYAGKMFLLLSLDAAPASLNAKCAPERAVALRERYDAIRPGYHMNKQHWNTIILDGSVPDHLIEELIGHSLDLVIKKLPKKLRAEHERNKDTKK